MDYLAADNDFMGMMEARAEALLCRPSTGPEDSPFEDVMVDTMTALEERLAKQGMPASGNLKPLHESSTRANPLEPSQCIYAPAAFWMLGACMPM